MCSLAVLAAYMFRHIDKKAYGLYWHIDITILKEVFSISVWSMLQFFTSVAIWFLFFVAIERLGEKELAVSNIVRSVSALFSVIVNALAGVTGSLVSNLIGAGEKKKVFPLCHKIIRLGYATGIPLITFAFVLSPAHYRGLYGKSRYHTACMAAFSCHAIELLLCTTRLRLSECYNRNGSDTDGIHFSGDNYYCLSVLLMGIRLL